MSENRRVAAIIAVFVIAIAIVWRVFTSDVVNDTPNELNAPSLATRAAAEAPELVFDPIQVQSKHASSDSTTPNAVPTLNSEMPRSSKDGSVGRGRIFGTVRMPDGMTNPESITLSIRIVPDRVTLASDAVAVLATMQASADGTFEFSDLPFERLIVIGSSATLSGMMEITLTERDFVERGTLYVYPSASISGKVVTPSGDPVVDARVMVDESDSDEDDMCEHRAWASQVLTDATGAFELTGLIAEGSDKGYRLVAMAEGYAPEHTDFIATGMVDFEIVLDAGATLSGRVVNVDTDTAIPNTTVFAQFGDELVGSESTTDQNGAFTLAGLAPGGYSFSIDDTTFVVTPETASLEVIEDSVVEGLVIAARRGATISGRVYDRDTNLGVPNARVMAMQEDYSADNHWDGITNTDGQYSISGIPRGTLRVFYIEIEGYSRSSIRDVVETVTVDYGQAMPNVDFAVSKGLSVSGIVVDASGNPVSTASLSSELESYEDGDSGNTELDGTFALFGYEPDSGLTVNVEAPGMTTESMALDIASTSITDLRFVMEAESSISGVVVNASNEPVEYAGLYAIQSGSDHEWDYDSSNARGEFRLEGLKPGTYQIVSQGYEYDEDNEALATVTLASAQAVTDLRITYIGKPEFTGGFTITGRLTDDTGAPVNNGTVSAESLAGSSAYARSNVDGTFTLSELREGAHELTVLSPSHGTKTVTNVAAGTTSLSIVLSRRGVISGKIVSAVDGSPVVDFRIGFEGQGIDFGFNPDGQLNRYHHSEGLFSIDGAEPGKTTSLIVRASGFAEATVPVDGIRSGETRGDVLVQLQAENILTGTVVDNQGRPIAGASIYKDAEIMFLGFDMVPVHAVSGARGVFTLKGLGRGTVKVAVSKKGFVTKETKIDIVASTSEHTITLGIGGSVKGYVTLDGSAVPDVVISGAVSSDANNPMSMQLVDDVSTDERGAFLLTGLAGGTAYVDATIELSDGQSRSLAKEVVVEEGMVSDVEFQFTSGSATIEGYILVSETETQPGEVGLMLERDGVMDSRMIETDDNRHYPYGPARDHHGQVSSIIRTSSVVVKNDFAIFTHL